MTDEDVATARTYMDRVREQGFLPAEIQQLHDLGLSDNQIEGFREDMRARLRRIQGRRRRRRDVRRARERVPGDGPGGRGLRTRCGSSGRTHQRAASRLFQCPRRHRVGSTPSHRHRQLRELRPGPADGELGLRRRQLWNRAERDPHVPGRRRLHDHPERVRRLHHRPDREDGDGRYAGHSPRPRRSPPRRRRARSLCTSTSTPPARATATARSPPTRGTSATAPRRPASRPRTSTTPPVRTRSR